MSTAGSHWQGYFRFCGLGGDGGGIDLSIMADIDHNCMKRCDSQETCMASFLMYPGELTGAYGGMNWMESSCVGIGFESGDIK